MSQTKKNEENLRFSPYKNKKENGEISSLSDTKSLDLSQSKSSTVKSKASTKAKDKLVTQAPKNEDAQSISDPKLNDDLKEIEENQLEIEDNLNFSGTGSLGKFLDPKNDIAFRRIFGTEKNKDILIHFLNDILGFTGEKELTYIRFLNTIQDPEIKYKKQSIVDVLCEDSTGAQWIIEMQVAKTKGFEKRAQYYAAKAYSGQACKGGKYHALKEIFFIAIADCVLFPDKFEYKSKHTIRDEHTNEHNLKDFCFVFIELPKFSKTKDQLLNIVEKWVYFFKHAPHETSKEELEKIIGKDVIIKKAYDELDRFNWSDYELRCYDQVTKHNSDEEAVFAQKIDDAREKGKTEGKIEVAKEMLASDVDLNTIVKCTGLSIVKVQELIQV